MSDHSTAPVISFPISDILIPPERQRKDAKADEVLINSIRTNGLLNPIIVHADGTLVAGERRLDAFRQLEHSTIPVRIFEHLEPLEAHRIELLENMARKQLSWQEETAAIAAYHDLRLQDFAAWTMQGTATDLGISASTVTRVLAVAKHLDDPDVAGAASFAGAANLIEARANRVLAAATARGLVAADTAVIIPANATREEKTELLAMALEDDLFETAADVGDLIDKVERAEEASRLLREAEEVEREISGDDRIIQGSFLEWAPVYSGPAFDVIHCDFPYGKDYSGSNTRRTGRATTTPTYADAADIYFELVDCFLENQDRFALPQAHCIFWFDMIHYCWTIEQFRHAGWSLAQPHPLIWTKSYQGVAADTKRRPRHCYETALLFSRGDRHIRKLEKDHFEEQVDVSEKLHMSQKPVRMLEHFLSLVVDEHTAVLDPTCGSGTALAAAGKLGASRLLGLELEPSHCDIARFTLQKELPQ